MSLAIGERPLPGEVRHGVVAVADRLERIQDPRFAEGALDQEQIVRIIFHDENDLTAGVHAFAPSTR